MKRNLYFSLILWLALLVLALSITYRNQYVLLPATLILILATDRSAFKILLNWKVSLLLLSLMALFPLVAGMKDARLLGVPYSTEYFRIGLVMAERGLVLLLAVRMLTNRISMDQVSGLFTRLRFRKFGAVFSAASEITPYLREMVTDAYQRFRTRRGLRRWKGLMQGLTDLLSRIVLFAENYPEQSNQGNHDE